MAILNFASYAKAIRKGIPNSEQLEVTNLLLGLLINRPGVLNRNREPYHLNSQNTARWWNQKEDIPRNIKNAAARPDVIAEASDYFDIYILNVLTPPKDGDTYACLLNLIKQQDMSDETRDRLISLHRSNELSDFLAQTFLYAIQTENKVDLKPPIKKQPTDLQEDVRKLRELLEQFPKPHILMPPDVLEDHEMIYIQELLAAYADAENSDIFTRDDLDSHQNYKRDFSHQRNRYYSAESIRQSLRDTLLPEEYTDFESLKKETLSDIQPVHEQYYQNGFERLNRVMAHATLIQLNRSLLAQLPGWIGGTEIMGICHMLVNDGEIRWVDNDE